MTFISRILVPLVVAAGVMHGQRQMENLTCGVVAIPQAEGKVFVSWRLLGADPDAVGFNVYRSSHGGRATKLNPAPITKVTWFLDHKADPSVTNSYSVRAVLKRREEAALPPAFAVAAGAPIRQYLSIPFEDS
ncbi:MAG TPA: hypothetical protein VER03_24320 [Bryobacteraceae bacterium]|nr:hypothetical protein [Bryobacteraceae bacterium]